MKGENSTFRAPYRDVVDVEIVGGDPPNLAFAQLNSEIGLGLSPFGFQVKRGKGCSNHQLFLEYAPDSRLVDS